MRLTLTFALQASQIFRQVGFILTSILLAKSGLATGDIGLYETLFFIATTVSYFWLNGFMQGFLVFVPSVALRDRSAAFFNIVLLFNVLSVFIFVCLFFFPSRVAFVFTGGSGLSYLDLFSIYLLFGLPPFVLESFWTVEGRAVPILFFSALSHLLLPLVIVFPLWFGGDFKDSFYGLIGLSVVRYVWLLGVMYRNNFFVVRFSLLIGYLRLSFPLIVYSFLNGFVMTFVFWIVNWFHSGEMGMFAIFRFGAREFPLSLALATGVSNAFVPLLSNTFAVSKLPLGMTDFNDLKRETVRLLHILFPLSIVLMLCSKWLFVLVFSPSFAASADVFNIFLLLLLSRLLFPQTILLALKATKFLLLMSIIETLSIILLSFLFIFRFDTEGVSWAVVIGFLIEKIGIIIFLKRRYGIDFEAYTPVRLYFLYSFCLILSYFIQLFYL